MIIWECNLRTNCLLRVHNVSYVCKNANTRTWHLINAYYITEIVNNLTILIWIIQTSHKLLKVEMIKSKQIYSNTCTYFLKTIHSMQIMTLTFIFTLGASSSRLGAGWRQFHGTYYSYDGSPYVTVLRDRLFHFLFEPIDMAMPRSSCNKIIYNINNVNVKMV